MTPMPPSPPVAPPRSAQEKIRRAFSESSDPSGYVPRNATEVALSLIHGWAEETGLGSTVAALMAEPGAGKTCLLRIFESQLNAMPSSADRSDRVLYLPYASLSISDLCIWIHGLLGRSFRLPDGNDQPAAALSALLALADEADEPFFLLLDDADSMPRETIDALTQGLPTERSSLRILMALNPDAKASRLLAALDPLHPRLVELQGVMSDAETGHYLYARMRWAGFTEDEIAQMDSETVSQIYTRSGGLPRRIHTVAAAFFEAAGAGLPPELGEKQKREDWMGRPIEEDL